MAFVDTLPGDSLSSLFNSGLPSDFDAELRAAGLPAERAARIAARRAFVEMKHIFMRAVATLMDRKGEWLRHQVRLANEPLDLWLLRGPVLAALRQNDSATRGLRAELYRGLDSLFPHGHSNRAPASAMPNPLPEPWALAGVIDAWRHQAGRAGTHR